VLLGLWLGRWLGSPDRIGVELAFAALLVVGLAAGDPRCGVTRLWEAALGGLVAAAINVLVLPPDYPGRVAKGLDALAAEIAAGLRDAAATFVEHHRHTDAEQALERLRVAQATLADVEAQLRLAAEALRLSPLRQRRRLQIERDRAALQLYAQALDHAIALARIAREHAARPHRWRQGDLAGPAYLAQAAEALAHALERYQAYVRSGAVDALSEVRHELARAQGALATFLRVAERERAAQTAVERLIDIAAFASELEHLAVADLAAALRDMPPEQPTAFHSARP
jgi:hypothetical protein